MKLVKLLQSLKSWCYICLACQTFCTAPTWYAIASCISCNILSNTLQFMCRPLLPGTNFVHTKALDDSVSDSMEKEWSKFQCSWSSHLPAPRSWFWINWMGLHTGFAQCQISWDHCAASLGLTLRLSVFILWYDPSWVRRKHNSAFTSCVVYLQGSQLPVFSWQVKKDWLFPIESIQISTKSTWLSAESQLLLSKGNGIRIYDLS